MSKKSIFFISCLLFATNICAQVSICSWNLENFGKSKSTRVISFIANLIKDYDVIAIQEVVAGPGGPQAVAKLADELNRKGNKWAYVISDKTSGSSYKTERYAFIWKNSKVIKSGSAWLEKKYNLEIDREPFYATFKCKDKEFTLVNFHAITKSRQPETEIKYFKYLPGEYPDKNLIFIGDFNCPQTHTVFIPLKSMGYKPAITNQKTSLKQTSVRDNYLASEFDNIFYPVSKIMFLQSGVVHFYKSLATLQQAREISDHIPVFFQFLLN